MSEDLAISLMLQAQEVLNRQQQLNATRNRALILTNLEIAIMYAQKIVIQENYVDYMRLKDFEANLDSYSKKE